MDDHHHQESHVLRMQRKKAMVEASMDGSQESRGSVILLTGNGKGKTTAAFGNLYRTLGHGYRAGLVQFIKGQHSTGEITSLQQFGVIGQGVFAQVDYYAMATGFTWDSQDWDADRQAAQLAWSQAQRMLADESLHLVVLDELTYMLNYGYLDAAAVVHAVQSRPAEQTVVITGRDASIDLCDMADTLSEIVDVRHAFRAGVKARAGVDF